MGCTKDVVMGSQQMNINNDIISSVVALASFPLGSRQFQHENNCENFVQLSLMHTMLIFELIFTDH